MLDERMSIERFLKMHVEHFGKYFSDFMFSLFPVFTHIQNFRAMESIPEQIMLERVILIAILEAKSFKYSLEDRDIINAEIMEPVYDSRRQIMEMFKLMKKGLRQEQLDLCERKILKYMENPLSKNNYRQEFNHYLYFLIVAVMRKTPEFSILKKIKSLTHAPAQIQKVGQAFKENVHYMHYEKCNKTLTAEFGNPKLKHIYILYMKGVYYLLSPKDMDHLKKIEVVKSSEVKLQSLESIFSGKKESMIEEMGKSDLMKSREILFSPNVLCRSCNHKYPEFDCLFWNYKYYCGKCLVDIDVDTSGIPPSKIQKYCKERELIYTEFDKKCPECSRLTTIKHYRPENKPTRFRCTECSKLICVVHRCFIKECFCFCLECKSYCLFISHLNLNFCSTCKSRYCFNCQKTTRKDSFCACICQKCLKIKTEKHKCEPACHICYNQCTKLKDCKCGGMICYGCLYLLLEKNIKEEQKQKEKGKQIL